MHVKRIKLLGNSVKGNASQQQFAIYKINYTKFCNLKKRKCNFKWSFEII